MPRQIIGAAFVSLDGVMQGPGGPTEDPTGGFPYGGWLEPVGDDALEKQVGGLFSEPFDLLLGRRTYDIFASYWPYQSRENPIAALFAECGKFVLTHSDQPLEWQGSERLADIDALAALKATDGPDLVIQGSSTIYPQIMERGLLDKLILLVAPVVLGTGKRLFAEGTPGATFKLVDQFTGSRGCTVFVMVPAGPIAVGSFGPADNPSVPEIERRRKMEEGTW
jgi:dihydrofolate reductase